MLLIRLRVSFSERCMWESRAEYGKGRLLSDQKINLDVRYFLRLRWMAEGEVSDSGDYLVGEEGNCNCNENCGLRVRFGAIGKQKRLWCGG